MDTDQLTRHLHEASAAPPFLPDVAAALRRADRLRHRRVAAGVVTAVVLATGVTAGVGAVRSAPHAASFAAGGPAATSSGGVDFTLRYAPKDACGVDVVLPAGSAPPTIALPCALPVRPADQDAPSGRADFVGLSGGPTRLVNSGTAPGTTVAVLAVSQDGQPLTATLRTLPETGEVVWAMQSAGNTISDLHYVLADGRRSQSNSVTEPR